ncbi:pentapeptide repeat-containing protein [Phaeobacter sp. CNT1-3]|nr:pentapeptide repeat-containing protein [Phaeobacter sp. CNT1-3]
MKNDITIEEIWPESKIRNALTKLEEADLPFSELVELLGMQKENDFQNSSLTNVDFSNADLRGFNFKGADLRNAHGIDVQIDQTTNLTGALVEGSIFQSLTEERALFEDNASATVVYEALKHGDPYDVSGWISSNGEQLLSKKFKNITKQQSAILCKKLIVDDIDLTKRTTLFYHLDKFTRSNSDLRMVVKNFVAFHLDNPSVIRSFVSVAAQVLSKDEFVSRTILSLCGHKNVDVKEAAFMAIEKTPLFACNIRHICNLFFSQHNAPVRKQIILKTAIKLGGTYVLSVNAEGKTSNLDSTQVLDYHELLNEEIFLKVRASQGKRQNILSNREIELRQKEILANAPVFSTILARQGTDWLQTAIERSQIRKRESQKQLNSKIRNSLRRYSP